MRKHKKGIAVGALMGLLVATGIAAAAWLRTQDNAKFGAKGGTLTDLVIVADSGAGKKCFPGQTCDAVADITNPNGAVTITGWSAATLPLPSPGPCDGHLSVPTKTGQSVLVPAGANNDVILPDAFALAAGAPDSCQGQPMYGAVKVTFSTG